MLRPWEQDLQGQVDGVCGWQQGRGQRGPPLAFLGLPRDPLDLERGTPKWDLRGHGLVALDMESHGDFGDTSSSDAGAENPQAKPNKSWDVCDAAGPSTKQHLTLVFNPPWKGPHPEEGDIPDLHVGALRGNRQQTAVLGILLCLIRGFILS